MAQLFAEGREDVPEKEREKYDAFVEKRGGTVTSGTYSLLLHMPEVAQKVESLRLTLRDEASVSQPIQEIVMLTVAREMDCAYIWQAHAAAARGIGVHGDIVDNLRENKPLTNLQPDEKVAVDFARELLRDRKVSKSTFDRAGETFGRRGTLTLTNLVACYATLAYVMNTYELEAPVHASEKPLPVSPRA
jgi:4-carboxymuconolactone decarboxylase